MREDTGRATAFWQDRRWLFGVLAECEAKVRGFCIRLTISPHQGGGLEGRGSLLKEALRAFSGTEPQLQDILRRSVAE